MKKLLFGFLALPLVAAACSGRSEGGGDDGSDFALSDFLASYCRALMPCCVEAALPADGAQCRALLGSTFTATDYGFDETAAKECSAWLDTVNGTAFCEGTGDFPEVCAEVFTPEGHGAPGDGCSSPGDCALSSEGGVRCVESDAGGRSCQLVVEGTEGSTPCAWTVLEDGTSISSSNQGEPRVYSCDVADGLRCDGTACVRLVPAGGACVLSEECAVGTYCSSASCTPRVPTGSACTYYDQCLGGACENQVCGESDDLGLVLVCGGSSG